MSSKLERGERIKLLIYFIDSQKVRGYSTVKKKEYTAIIDTSKYNIQYGEILAFTVSKSFGERTFEPSLDQVTNEGKPSYVQIIGKGIQTKVYIKSFMIFPLELSSLDNHSVCWSADGYGWIYVPTYYMQTTNIFYSAYITRDSTTCARNADCLFTIANPKQIHIVEEGKKNLQSNLEEMAEAVRIRLEKTKQSPPENFLANFIAPPLTSKELREKQKKMEANQVSTFLVINLSQQVGIFRGMAWSTQLRAIGMTVNTIYGDSTSLVAGKWYDGVVKWNKRAKAYDGFYVDKVWREATTPRFNTYVEKEQIIIEDEVSFPLKTDYELVRDDNNYMVIYIPHPIIEKIAVMESIYREYQGKSCVCLLAPYSLQDQSTKQADWIVKKVKNVLGDVGLADWRTEFHQAQFPEEVDWEGPSFNGGPPLSSDSEDDIEGSYDEEENPTNMKSSHFTQPQHGIVHPKAGYEPMEKKGAYQKNQEVQKFKWNDDDIEEQQQKGECRDFNNREMQQSTNYSWNQDEERRDERRGEDRQRQWVQSTERQNNFSNQPGYNDRRSDMKSDYGWNRDEELWVEQRQRTRNDWSEDRDDRRNHSRRSDSPPQRSDYGSQRGKGQHRNYFKDFDVDYDAGKCKMEPCLCIDSSPNGSTFFCPGRDKADRYTGHAILIPNYQIKLGSWVEMFAYKVRSKNRAGADYVGIYDSIKKMMMSIENIFIRDELLYMDVCTNLRFKKPIGYDKYSLYSEEIGKIISKHDLDFEKGGRINLTDMQQCRLGQEWRVWIRYNYHIGDDGYGYYQWDVLKVRGPKREVEEYDASMSRIEIKAIFDDIDMDKQRTHLLHYQTIDINGQNSSSSHSSYDKLTDLPTDRSKASYNDNSSNASRAEPRVSYDKLLKLHHLFYKNNEIRQQIKVAEYDAYVEFESICKETLEEYGGNRPPAVNSRNASRFSAPSREFQQPPTDNNYRGGSNYFQSHHMNVQSSSNGRTNNSNYSWND